MIKKCIGCGVELQTEEKGKKGYTKSLDMDYCIRCFRWNHYKDYKIGNESVDKKEIIGKIKKKKGLTFFFIDFLNLHEEAILAYLEIPSPKILVVSKLDSIPRSIYLEKIKLWFKELWKIDDKVLFIQKNSKTSIKKIEQEILNSKEQIIYFAGITNAGKSTFLNSFLADGKITVSEMPNTTLAFLKMKYQGKTIYDTPGIYYAICNDSLDFISKINVSSEIKPKNYPLKKEASLVIENLFRISFSCDNTVTFFGSNALKIEKIYQNNHRLQQNEKLELDVAGQTHLYIKGIGFMVIKEACQVTLYGVKKTSISVSKSFFSYEV